MKCIRAILEDLFTKLGCCVARHLCMFTICPLMLSFLLTTGIQKAQILQSIESLYEPSNSISVRDRTYLESLFPMNLSSNFYPERYTREGKFGSVIIASNDGDSIMRPHIFKEVFLVDQTIQRIRVYWDNRYWNYRHLCAKCQNVCFKNSIFDYENNLPTKNNFKANIHLEHWLNPQLFSIDYSNSGIVLVNDENKSTLAKAVRLSYYLDDSTESRRHLAHLWEDTFIDKLKSLKLSNISIAAMSSTSLENLSLRIFQRNVLYTFIMLSLMAFCWLVTSFKPNSFQGKPWMGVVIVISSGLAVAAGHGLLMYCNVYFVPTTVVSVIVILGITTVDTLAMISVWKMTDSKKSVEDRLGETYSIIGVPIVASFSINFFSSLIATAFSPLQEFRMFCFYMSSCLALGFLHQLTLIGGCMAAYGYAEKKNLNSLTFRSVKITSAKGKQHSLCSCRDWKSEDNSNERLSSFRNIIFRSTRKTITYAQTKSFLILLYIAYLATSIWGITDLENDYTFKELTSQDTYVSSYFQKLYENFSQYRGRIQLVLNTTLNYADPDVQSKINAIMDIFESAEYGQFQTKSWLKNYLEFLSNKKVSFVLKNYNMTDKVDFLHVLRHHFLRYPHGNEYVNDLVFDQVNSDIIASRFLLHSHSPKSEEDYWKKLQKVRYVSNEKFFPTIVYHPKFFVYEGTDLSLPTTLVQLCTTALITAVACSVTLSSVIHGVIICFSFLSVSMGVLGYLALWNVGINPISSKYLMCFSSLSVSYLTHSACAYTATNSKNKDILCWKIHLTILQGSIVSILSMVAVFIRPSWTLPSAFKSGFLTSVFAALHAICFQTTTASLYDSINYRLITWSTASCSRKRDCAIPGKFRHPAVGGIYLYNGSVVISHIDLAR